MTHVENKKNLVFVDCEGHGVAPTFNDDDGFEFGAVCFGTGNSFHGIGGTKETFEKFYVWLAENVEKGRPVFVSDNVAYDWQFINYYFHKYLGGNPFGHSGRRISDFYAGVVKDWHNTQEWKKWRITNHDHNPVHNE